MTQDTARLILMMLTALGGAVWLAGLTALLVASRSDLQGVTDPDADEPPGDDLDGPARRGVAGSAEVEGLPAELSARAAAILARQGTSGMLRIIERTDRRITFEGTGLFPALGLGHRSRVVLQFEPVGRERTRVRYRGVLPGARPLLWIGGLFQVLGLIGLVAGSWAMNRYVVTSPNLAIRSQVVQMIQVVHVLWPPFLFAHFHRRPRALLRGQLDALIHNLPYLDPEHMAFGTGGFPPVPR